MKLQTILLVCVLGILIYSRYKCHEGYINSLTCDVTIQSETNLEAHYSDSLVTPPQDLTGKFIDIDARDPFYLYAVTDDHKLYRCLKPCKDTKEKLFDATFISLYTDPGASALANQQKLVISILETQYDRLLEISNRAAADVDTDLSNNAFFVTYPIDSIIPNPNGNNYIITISGNNLPDSFTANDKYPIFSPDNNTPVSWERIPFNLSGYDITKIYASPDGNFLWGLDKLGDPVYTFQENEEILKDFESKLLTNTDELFSYTELGSGKCKHNKLQINDMIQMLDSEENVEACEELCNNEPNCKYMSYSNLFRSCSIYSGGLPDTDCSEDPPGRIPNSNFTTYRRNNINVQGLVDQI